MAVHRTPVCWGAAMARDEHDRACGFQAYGIRRGARKGMGTRVFTGPVRETYNQAAGDARAAADSGRF